MAFAPENVRFRPLSRAWPWATLLLAGLALHAREFLGERLIKRDLQDFYVPVKSYLAATLRAGELPQWWPFDAAGTPLLAQPQFSVFHPTTLLYLVLPFWHAFTAQNLVITWIALLGAYVLARALDVPRWAAVVSGVLFGASGYLASLTEHPFMKLGAGTMPWYGAALLVAHRRGGRWSLLPVVAMGLLLLGGDPQMALLASAFGLVLLLVEEGGTLARKLVLAVAAPVGGAALAAVQLVPSLLLAPETERSGLLKNAHQWPLEPRHLWGMLQPLDHGPGDFAPSTYVGLAGLVLALVSLTTLRRRRVVGALWLVVVLSLWLAAGDAFLLNALAKRVVPLWNQFRFPIKAVLPAFLALALLAGLGAAELVALRGRPRWLAGAGAGALLLALGASLHGTAAPLSAGLLLVVTAVVLVGAAHPRLGWLAALVCAAHAVVFAARVQPLVPADFYARPTFARLLQERGVGLAGPAMDSFDWSVRPEAEQMAARAAVGGGGRSSYGALFSLPSVSAYSPSTSMRMRSVEEVPWNDVRAGLFGVQYVVLREPVPAPLERRVIAREPAFELALVELRQALPRAYAVHRARPAPSAAEAVAALAAPDFKPGREIVVDGDWKPDWGTRPDELAVPARIVARTNASVSIESTLPWPGFVVLNEAYFRGWSATVDGAPAPVLPANGAMRAVEVPAGAHRVEFRFTTPGLREGAAVSVLAWSLCVLVAFLRRRPAAVAEASRPASA